MSVICLKVSRKNYKLSTLARASASHTDRSNSQASLLDTHRMSRVDMPGNSIFSELIVYLRKLVFPITGMSKSCNCSTHISHLKHVTLVVSSSRGKLQKEVRESQWLCLNMKGKVYFSSICSEKSKPPNELLH